MKLCRQIVPIVLCLLLLPGCYDQMYLEDTSIALMLGLDVDKDNNLVIFSQSPVFYKEAKEKTETISVTANSIRSSRPKLDAVLTGITTGGKLQSIILGKRLLAQKDWISVLDLFYRIPKMTETPRVIVVDGEVKDVFEFKPIDKPRLSLHMRTLIDTARKTNITVATNLQELRRQMKDKGMTAVITQVKKEPHDIVVTGVALLDKHGAVAEHLTLQESELFLVLQKQNFGSVSISYNLDDATADTDDQDDQQAIRNAVSFDIINFKKKIKTSSSGGKFRFDITLKLNVVITTFQYDDPEAAKLSQLGLQKKIQANLQREFDSIVNRCQKKAIDPFGLGRYARAYQYQAWKPVQDHWGEAFGNADVRMHVHADIKNNGVTDLYSPQ
ncbi:Ger(x)C family spore germination protein [Paenibacillus silvisoli]|uniref:Ger(x)C family spore germination protein n=1 Tax=Paenibacillus silvisoli TaxID=3110539 RepID=UPI00280520D5|nr:Ger(x)C family spore germination protein [Paenibacillus silvisoli]